MKKELFSIHAARARSAMLAGLLAALVGPGAAVADDYVYGCVLSDKQVVVPTGSPALGGGQFYIDTDANTVSYRVAFVDLAGTETAAHIHGPADPGASAGVLAPLPAGNPKVGVWNYLEAQEGDILAGKTYMNIHTNLFPGGEVRGQIVPLNASLDGEQEVPPTPSPGSGWAVFTIDTNTNELGYYIAIGGLAGVETGAHIHGQALHGSSAGVAVALPAGSPKVGVWTYTETQEEAILSGRMYVNVHTAAFPSGEIRGQIVPIVVPIDGQQEVPPNPSPGAGIGLVSFDTSTDDLSYDVRFRGLAGSETAAHIHGFAVPGSSAGVLQAMPLGNRKLGVWNFGAAAEPAVLAGETYFNIHSSAVPGGEIRGQIRGFPRPVGSGVAERAGAAVFQLAQMTPNPLRGAGSIQFELARATRVDLSVCDLQGRRVRDLGGREWPAGAYAVAWDGRDDAGRPVTSGVYHYVLQTPEGRIARSVSLLR